MENNQLLSVLKKYWGYESFRSPQQEIIEAVIDQQDVLAVLPTGAGKSLCFQLPAIYLGGTTIVISPLIALMNDQVEQLTKRGINAYALHSNLDKASQETVLSQIRNKDYALLYISPEKLASAWFQDRIFSLNIRLIAIDEAHCISQWGYDFRAEYLKIAESTVSIDCPRVALTASATPVVQQDIQDKLVMKAPQVFSLSTFRENLSYKVLESDDKQATLIRLVSQLKGSGIIYLKTRKMCHEVGEMLNQASITHQIYHAGLSRELREKAQRQWINNEVQIILATNAFGMGIDKADVRTVIHYGAPNTLEAYYQEAGRAGRDGKTSTVYLIVGANDHHIAQQVIDRVYQSTERVKQVFQSLCDMLQVAEGFWSEKLFRVAIEGLKQRSGFEFMDIHYSLKLLELSGIISYEPEHFSPSTLKILQSPDRLFSYYENNPTFEKIVKAIIRIYGAQIYDSDVRINEQSIAAMAEVSAAKLGEILTFLSQNNIVHYFKGTDMPVIRFLLPRPQAKNLPLDNKLIKFLKERAHQHLEDMYNFIDTSTCKQQYLSSYFGKELAHKCGTCSSCIEISDIDFKKELKLWILYKMQADLGQIKTQFPLVAIDSIAQSLNELMFEEGLKKNAQDQFYFKV